MFHQEDLISQMITGAYRKLSVIAIALQHVCNWITLQLMFVSSTRQLFSIERNSVSYVVGRASIRDVQLISGNAPIVRSLGLDFRVVYADVHALLIRPKLHTRYFECCQQKGCQ